MVESGAYVIPKVLLERVIAERRGELPPSRPTQEEIERVDKLAISAVLAAQRIEETDIEGADVTGFGLRGTGAATHLQVLRLDVAVKRKPDMDDGGGGGESDGAIRDRQAGNVFSISHSFHGLPL